MVEVIEEEQPINRVRRPTVAADKQRKAMIELRQVERDLDRFSKDADATDKLLNMMIQLHQSSVCWLCVCHHA